MLADSADAGGHRALLWYNRIDNTEAVALHKKGYCAGHTKGRRRVGARQAYHLAAARSPRNTRPVDLHGSNVAPRQAAHAAPVAKRQKPEALGGQAHNAELLHAVAVQLDCACAVVHGNGARVEYGGARASYAEKQTGRDIFMQQLNRISHGAPMEHPPPSQRSSDANSVR